MSLNDNEDLGFEKLLLELSSEIAADSLPDLKSLCKSVLSEELLQDVPTCEELLSLLCRNGLLSRFNWPQLVELMSSIDRNDLTTRVLVYGKKESLQVVPEQALRLPEGSNDAMVVFTFSANCNLAECIPSLLLALSMFVTKSGLSTIWFMGVMAPVTVAFRMTPENAEQVMDIVNQKPAWLIEHSAINVECGEHSIQMFEDLASLESSVSSLISEPVSEAMQSLDARFHRLVNQLVGNLTGQEEIVKRCSLVLNQENFNNPTLLGEVFDDLIRWRLLTPYNLIQLAELMSQVGRSDLSKRIYRKSRKYGFMIAEDEGILPQELDGGRVLVRFDVKGKQPTGEKITNIMDGFSMIMFKTALPILWYLACVSNEEHHLYFVTKQRNVKRIIESARNGHPWLIDVGIVMVETDTDQVVILRKDTEESVLEERNRRLAIGAKAGNQNLVETLLGLGASVTYKGMDEVTALHRACFGDNHQIVELLISYGAEVNGSTKEELLQPLHIVADKGNLKIAEILLNAGADINALALGDLTPLHIAAARGHLDMVERLIYGKGGKKAIVVAADQDGDHPLHYASLEGHAKIVSLLLEKGALVNARAKDGQTPMHWAAGNNHQAVVDILCDEGADPNCRDINKCTPLHWAADAGNCQMAEKLLIRGCDVNAQNESKEIALHWAGSDGFAKFSRILLEYGSKVNLQDKNDVTPFQLCVSEGHTDVAEHMVVYGADVNEEDKNGCTVLHMAALNGYHFIAKLLLREKCKVDKRTIDSFTPLHYASLSGHVAIVEQLLQHGAEVNAIDNEGWNSLHFAAYHNHPAVIEVLLQYRADIYAEDKVI